ncbi:MAG: hypothetical protein ACKVZJ_10935 [Phycisphaerales bacterium]
MEPTRYVPQPRPLPEKPRKVRGGLRLGGEWPPRLTWAAAAWVEGLSRCASGDAFQHGVEYAKAGQMRTLTIEPAKVVGEVQGRQYRPHRAAIEFAAYSDTQWHAVETAMTEQAVFAAKLLAHEVPENIQHVFAPLSLTLYPVLAAAGSTMPPPDMQVTCTCGHPTPWCKHAVCTALLLAERMDKNPFLIFTLRGLPGDELIERLRSRRAASQGGDMFTQSLTQRLSGLTPRAQAPTAANDAGFADDESAATQQSLAAAGRGVAAPIESCIASFWEMGPGLDELETPLKPPEVSHPLLRRLGPSPFKEGKFPLVGLLATCYETISKAAMQGATQPGSVATVSDADLDRD